MSAPEITTERLTLNSLRPADAADLFAYRSDPRVTRYQSWTPHSREEALDFITDMQSVVFDTPGSWYQLAIRIRGTSQIIGDLGIFFSPEEPAEVEIGFTISPANQLRGYGSEAVAAVLERIFTDYHKHYVCAFVDPHNRASLALLKRVGMRREADDPQRPDERKFGLTLSQWRQDDPDGDG